MTDPRIEALRQSVARHHPRTRDPDPGVRPAAVALVVRPEPTDLELLLIQRAEFAGDPWSGHMAFPGGRRSAHDASSQDTAVRETREEVGIDLAAGGALLGRLDDVHPRSGAPPVAVSPYVFAVAAGTHTTLNHEVARALWIPLRGLVAPGAATEYLHALEDGQRMRFPALGYQEHLIWGLTYRILSQFLEFVREANQGVRGE